jgi:PII-like signaling protein
VTQTPGSPDSGGHAPGGPDRGRVGGEQGALEVDALTLGADGLMLTVYFGERSRIERALLADRLLDLYSDRKVLVSVLLRGAHGFGAKHQLRTDRLLSLSEDLPVVAIALDRGERILALAREVAAIVPHGLVTLERAHIVDSERPIPDATDALKLSILVGRHERSRGRPAFATACEILYEQGVAGATVLLGVDGTRHGQRERARFFARNERVPTIVLAVGGRQGVLASLERLREELPDALFALERVRICKRDGRLLARPETVAPVGVGLLQKLTVVVSEAATHAGRPVHAELVRRLRRARLAGATALRGMWGFHGSHAPHGDRLLALRRHVPVVVTVIDAPEQIAGAFPLIDELTQERGLVTSELVPANMALSARL